VGATIKGIYFLFFGWWLDPKMVRKLHEDLVHDVQIWLGFLFTDYGARIIPNVEEPPPLFDYALVTLSVGELAFRIFRGRETVRLSVAAPPSTSDFHEFSTVLSAMDSGVDRQGFNHLIDVERVLKPHMKDLIEAFSPRRYPQIKDRLKEIYNRDRMITKQLETEINRRLYG
jgi:hypothetical protein